MEIDLFYFFLDSAFEKKYDIPLDALHIFPCPVEKWMIGSFSQFVLWEQAEPHRRSSAEEEEEARGGLDARRSSRAPPRGFHPCSSPQNQLKKQGGLLRVTPIMGQTGNFLPVISGPLEYEMGGGDLCFCFGLSVTMLST